MGRWDSIQPRIAHPTNTNDESAVTVVRNWGLQSAKATLQHWLQSLQDWSKPPLQARPRLLVHSHPLKQMPAAPAQSPAWPYKQAEYEWELVMRQIHTHIHTVNIHMNRLASKSSSNAMANFSASSNRCLWRSLLSLVDRRVKYKSLAQADFLKCRMQQLVLSTCFLAEPLWSTGQQLIFDPLD